MSQQVNANVDANVDQYVVIGHPIAHSKSPLIHAMFAAQTGQTMHYDRLLAPLDGFVHSVQAFRAAGGKGMNVTVPFKLEACALADQLTERARMAGAVNTFKFEDAQIVGDNTDGLGLVNDIVQNAQFSLTGKHLLLLGAGGAARGVLLPLMAQQPASLTIANRSIDKAHQLITLFGAHASATLLKAAEFSQLTSAYDVVINATSAGLSDQTLPITPNIFSANGLAYDMVYGAQPSAFLQMAAARGTQTRDGLGMLVEQAAASFYWWRGVMPATAPVLFALQQSLKVGG